MVLARAVQDPRLSDELLESVRQSFGDRSREMRYVLMLSALVHIRILKMIRRLGEHRRWSQSGHNKSPTLTS